MCVDLASSHLHVDGVEADAGDERQNENRDHRGLILTGTVHALSMRRGHALYQGGMLGCNSGGLLLPR